MKIEPRGKYPGVKVHLDEKETAEILTVSRAKSQDDDIAMCRFVEKLGRKIRDLQAETPTLLEPRTEEEIRAELIEERDKSIAKLAAMDQGQDWKKVGK